MIDHPDAATLLTAVAAALDTEVVPALGTGAGPVDVQSLVSARYTGRIAANLTRILAREAVLGEEAARATRTDLTNLLKTVGTLEELVAALDRALTADPGLDRLDPAAVHRVLSANVERRLAIARPEYRRSSDR